MWVQFTATPTSRLGSLCQTSSLLASIKLGWSVEENSFSDLSFTWAWKRLCLLWPQPWYRQGVKPRAHYPVKHFQVFPIQGLPLEGWIYSWLHSPLAKRAKRNPTFELFHTYIHHIPGKGEKKNHGLHDHRNLYPEYGHLAAFWIPSFSSTQLGSTSELFSKWQLVFILMGFWRT